MEFIGRKIGEKAEAAEVNAHHGDLLAGKPAGSGQKRAVAAQDENGVCLNFAERDAAILIHTDDFDALSDPCGLRIEKGLNAGAGDVRNDEEAHWDRFSRGVRGFAMRASGGGARRSDCSF